MKNEDYVTVTNLTKLRIIERLIRDLIPDKVVEQSLKTQGTAIVSNIINSYERKADNEAEEDGG